MHEILRSYSSIFEVVTDENLKEHNGNNKDIYLYLQDESEMFFGNFPISLLKVFILC